MSPKRQDGKPEDSQAATESYEMLWNLWSAGTTEYHQLMSTYLTALSILMATTALVLNAGFQMPGLFILSSLLSLGGVFMCIHMGVAAGRFTARNYHWECGLQEIEAREDWGRRRYFTQWEELREQLKPITWRDRGPFTPNSAIALHRRPWAKRMRAMPWVFGLLCACFFLASLLGGWPDGCVRPLLLLVLVCAAGGAVYILVDRWVALRRAYRQLTAERPGQEEGSG